MQIGVTLFLLSADNNPRPFKTGDYAHFAPIKAPDCDPARASGECGASEPGVRRERVRRAARASEGSGVSEWGVRRERAGGAAAVVGLGPEPGPGPS